MRHRPERKRYELPCVLVDVNTQQDFLSSSGSCRVANLEQVVPAMRRVVAWAKRNHVPVISAMECHRPGEVGPKQIPVHCVDGTPGQEKVEFTLFGSYVKVEGDNTLSVPVDLFSTYQQVIFRKRTSDFFLNPKADRFISAQPVREFVVMGLGVERSVKSIALGLLSRNNRVSLVVDSCGFWDSSEADLALRLMRAKDVHMLTVDELMARKLPRRVRYPLNSLGQITLRNGLYASRIPAAYRINGTNGIPGTNGHHVPPNGVAHRNGHHAPKI